MEYEPITSLDLIGTSAAMADDLRLAHAFMDMSERTQDAETARETYESARTAHDTVDRLLKCNLPASAVVREQIGADISRLRGRLAAYENGTR